ncbi:MAG: TPM domain-containing protein [Rhodobacteraceae bacterium]|nr:TPM domain-containing protein [Paracoccaceae bacterium]
MRALVFLVFCLLPGQIWAQSYPANISTYVNDFADLIDPETEAHITDMLREVREQRGVEMTVVTIESRTDYGPSDNLRDFATGLFNAWGVGDPTRNDGILILVARSDREMRIALGSGYPPAFDDRMQAVVDHTFLPWFREGDYAAGISAGTAETIRRSALDYVDTQTGTPLVGGRPDWLTLILSSIGGLVALGIGGAGVRLGHRRWQRNRPPACQTCGRKMQRLDEAADDAHLSAGQQAEESLASVDYDVWHCPTDGATIVKSYPSFWRSRPLCPECSFHTMNRIRHTLRAATTSRSGMAEINFDCTHCGHHFSRTETIPMLSSSSSSSSSSGFSGGSSSGGGAGGSW